MVLKHFYTDFCVSTIYWLYKIVLDLNNSPLECSTTGLNLRPLKTEDGSTDILYSWFQIIIFNESNAKVLKWVTKAVSIDKFLKGLYAS